jgi:hypothetical protein
MKKNVMSVEKSPLISIIMEKNIVLGIVPRKKLKKNEKNENSS